MTIQYIMLVSLGFLIASLITLLLAPIFWHRAVRLTSTKLRQSLPLSEQEILADKDQLRAKYAIRVHQLEKQVEQASLGGARQKIDLNRRDASISQLETDITRFKSDLEENQNARGVLEQTVADRIPKIEAKLDEARKLLMVRDREIAELSQSSRRQQEALNEARVINQKQASDIERARSQVLAYEAQSRKSSADGDLDGELAIRTELEMLRSRTRDQASQLDRLNAEISVSRANAASADQGGIVVPFDSPAPSPSIFGAGASVSMGESEVLIASQRREIAVLQAQLEHAKSMGEAAAAAVTQQTAGIETAVERELRTLKAQAEDQTSEILRLRTEVAAAVAEKGTPDSSVPSLRDNRIALKARVSGLEAKSNQQAETIQRLRAELAQSNERAARQAANFMDEMRQLGVAAHITQPRAGGPQETTRARNVSRRTQAVFEVSRNAGLTATASGMPTGSDAFGSPEPAGGTPPQPAPSLGRRLVASVGQPASSQPVTEPEISAAHSPPRVSNLVAALRGNSNASGANGGGAKSTLSSAAEPAALVDETLPVSPVSAPPEAAPAQRGPRLVDRIVTASDS
jgi:hypothetical protein